MVKSDSTFIYLFSDFIALSSRELVRLTAQFLGGLISRLGRRRKEEKTIIQHLQGRDGIILSFL